jgi:hypothetical protein
MTTAHLTRSLVRSAGDVLVKSLLLAGVTYHAFEVAPALAAKAVIPVIHVKLPMNSTDSSAVGSIGFDDVIFDAMTKSIFLPGGRSGNLYAIDATTDKPEASVVAGGFTKTTGYKNESHDFGLTSVVALPNGVLVATDRADPEAKDYPGKGVGNINAPTLTVIDPSLPAEKRVVSKTALLTKPDFIRYVASAKKIWISEPDGGNKMQMFNLPSSQSTAPVKTNEISFTDGPESLSIDEVRGVAYSNAGSTTVSVNLADGTLGSAKWESGCKKPKFIAVAAKRGIAFNACLEGGVVAHDVTSGAVVGILSPKQTGAGVDILGYNAELSHLYVASGKSQKLSIVAVLPNGSSKNLLSMLGQVSTGGKNNYTSNAVADSFGHVWIPRPLTGDVARFTDTYPQTK